MNAQKRDLVIASKRVAEVEGYEMLCATNACSNDPEPFSCYCLACDDTTDDD